jgi:cytochrome c peroxidase
MGYFFTGWQLKNRSLGLLRGALVLVLPLLGACQEPTAPGREKQVEHTLADLGALPAAALAPSDNPTTPEKIELGRFLFYDPILSGDKDVACASCHHPEFGYAESLEISIGVNGRGLGRSRAFQSPNTIPFTKRNAHTLLNTAFNGITAGGKYRPEQAPMFWDLRVEGLEAQALEPIKALEEMRGLNHGEEAILEEVVRRLQAIPAYQELFQAAFGGEEPVTAKNLAKALAAFERSLVTPNSRFDQFVRGDKDALSDLEQKGLQAFLKAGCAGCHSGPMFSDFELHVLGVEDHEQLPGPDAGKDGSFAFRTPTLRNLRFTAPYMHNGTLPTLRRVMEFYEDLAGKPPRNPLLNREQLDPLARGLKLEFKELRLIEDFLNSLNDPDFDRKMPDQVPSGLPVGGNIKG